jgi:hypothetical protein
LANCSKKGKAGGKQPFELKLLSIEEQLRLGQIMSEAQTIIASSRADHDSICRLWLLMKACQAIALAL